MESTIIDIIAIFTIFSSIITISIKNPVISVLFLISVFINISGYLVIIGLSFVGISYLIVYVGAVTVLFLFVIIIFNLQFTEEVSQIGQIGQIGQIPFNFNSSGSDFERLLTLLKIVSSIFIYEVIFVFENYFNGSFFSFTQFINYAIMYLNPIKPTFVYSIDSDMIFNNFTEIESLGIVIYTNCVIWFVLISIILLISIVGPISLQKIKSSKS